MTLHAITYHDSQGKSMSLYLQADSVDDAMARVGRAAINGEGFEVVGSMKVPAWLAKVMGHG